MTETDIKTCDYAQLGFNFRDFDGDIILKVCPYFSVHAKKFLFNIMNSFCPGLKISNNTFVIQK